MYPLTHKQPAHTVQKLLTYCAHDKKVFQRRRKTSIMSAEGLSTCINHTFGAEILVLCASALLNKCRWECDLTHHEAFLLQKLKVSFSIRLMDLLRDIIQSHAGKTSAIAFEDFCQCATKSFQVVGNLQLATNGSGSCGTTNDGSTFHDITNKYTTVTFNPYKVYHFHFRAKLISLIWQKMWLVY